MGDKKTPPITDPIAARMVDDAREAYGRNLSKGKTASDIGALERVLRERAGEYAARTWVRDVYSRQPDFAGTWTVTELNPTQRGTKGPMVLDLLYERGDRGRGEAWPGGVVN